MLAITEDRLIVGMTGISSSGKSTLAQIIAATLVKGTIMGHEDVAFMDLDNVYRDIWEVFEIQGIDYKLLSFDEAVAQVNWDDSRLPNYPLLVEKLEELKETGETEFNKYDKKSGTYLDEVVKVVGKRVVIVESFLLFSAQYATGVYEGGSRKGQPVLEDPAGTAQAIKSIIPYKVFVDCDENVAKLRRLARDRLVVPRNYEETLGLWDGVIEGSEKYIYPLRNQIHFDRVIDNTGLDLKAIDDVYWDIVRKLDIPVESEFAYDSTERRELIQRMYKEKQILDAKQILERFEGNNNH